MPNVTQDYFSGGSHLAGSTPEGLAAILRQTRAITTYAPNPAADIALLISHGKLRIDATHGVIHVDLPTAANTDFIGVPFTVKKVDAGANEVKIAPFGAELIEGIAPLGLASEGDAVTFVSNGTGWDVIAAVTSFTPST